LVSTSSTITFFFVGPTASCVMRDCFSLRTPFIPGFSTAFFSPDYTQRKLNLAITCLSGEFSTPPSMPRRGSTLQMNAILLFLLPSSHPHHPHTLSIYFSVKLKERNYGSSVGMSRPWLGLPSKVCPEIRVLTGTRNPLSTESRRTRV